MMSKQETIELNGKTYVEYKESAEIKPAVETDHIIVIAQRGWIFEGHIDKRTNDTHRTVTLRIPKGMTFVESLFYADLSLNMSDNEAQKALDEVKHEGA